MPTEHPRIHVQCNPGVFDSINEIAAEEGRSLSSIAQELMIEALERREDYYFSRLAEERESKPFKKISHEAAWRSMTYSRFWFLLLHIDVKYMNVGRKSKILNEG